MTEPPAATSQKKKWGTGTKVLVVFCVLVLAGCVALLLALTSDKGRAFVKRGVGIYKLANKARSAPGTKELREMGCYEVQIVDARELMQTTRESEPSTPRAFGEVVTCIVSPLRKSLECDDLARRYVSTVGPRPPGFVVSTTKIGEQLHCLVRYDADGKVVQRMSVAAQPPAAK